MFRLMSDSMKPILQNPGPSLSELERRARISTELTARVREALVGPEKDHVISASYRDATLIVTAESAAWASHIRYAQTEVLENVGTATGMSFTKLRVRVRGKDRDE
jgi:hypothetical protein